MATTQINPDANPETDTVDGSGVVDTGTNTAWATLRSTNFTGHQDAGVGDGTGGFDADNAAGTVGAGSAWKRIYRSIFGFKIPANLTGITDAVVKLHVVDRYTDLGDMDIVVVEHNGPASSSDLVNADFNIANFDFTTAHSDLKAISTLTEGAYNTLQLTASGIALVVPNTTIWLGVVLEKDRTNSAPGSTTDNAATGFIPQYADGTNKPILEITHAGGVAGVYSFFM